MSEECLFCGRGLVQDYGPPRFNCGTALKGTTLKGKSIYSRSDSCYETELARKDELLRRWLKNEINHVFQNSGLQEETRVSLANLEVVKVMEEVGENRRTIHKRVS